MGREILVTGASGFVGAHLAGLLVDRGYKVVALDNGPDPRVPRGVELLRADLTDPASLASVPRTWWGVIHLAAISVPSLFKTPAPVVANLQMTLNLLDHLDSARVLLVSSCHVYAPAERPRREDDPIHPQGNYGLSKHLCEQLMPHFNGRLDVRIARPFNHVGPGMRPELMIPSLVRRVLDHPPGDRSPLIMAGRDSVRDFIDVRDVAAAYLAILELKDPISRIYNVCTGQAVSVRDVVAEVLRLVGSDRAVQFQTQPNSPDDIPYVVGVPDRLRAESGWRPKFTLADSLRSLLPVR